MRRLRRTARRRKPRGLRLEQFESREMLTGLDELRASVSDLYDPNEVVVYVDGFETRLNSADFIQYITQAGGIDTVSYVPAPVRITTLQPLELDSLVSSTLNFPNASNNSNVDIITNSSVASVPESTPQLSDYRQQLFLNPQLNNAQIRSSYFGTVELQQYGAFAGDFAAETSVLGLDFDADNLIVDGLNVGGFNGTIYNSLFEDNLFTTLGSSFQTDIQSGLDTAIRYDRERSAVGDQFRLVDGNRRFSEGSYVSGFELDLERERERVDATQLSLTYPRSIWEGSVLADIFVLSEADAISSSDVKVFTQPLQISEVRTLDLANSATATDTYEQPLVDAAALMAKMPQHMMTPAQQHMINAVAAARTNTPPTKIVQARLRLTGIVGRTNDRFQLTHVSTSRVDEDGSAEPKRITRSSQRDSSHDQANQNRIEALLRYVRRTHSEEHAFEGGTLEDGVLDERVLDEINELVQARTQESVVEEGTLERSAEFEPDHVSSDFVLASLSFFGAGLVLNQFSKSSEEEDKQKGNPRLPR